MNTTEQASKAYKATREALYQTKKVLTSLGYTYHEVGPDFGDIYGVLVHPEYIEVFKTQYDPVYGFDPELNVPEWAVVVV